MIVRNLLADWISNTKSKSILEKQGMTAHFNDSGLPKNASLDLDGDQFVGTISYWQPNVFEFQFNSARTGDVVVLETLKLNTVDEISAYVNKLFQSKLIERGGE
jgi:hypothetical protein